MPVFSPWCSVEFQQTPLGSHTKEPVLPSQTARSSCPVRALSSQDSHHSRSQGATEGVVPNPPVRNVYPPICQARTRAVKVLVLACPIHDQKVTVVHPARARFTVRAGLRHPSEGNGRPWAQRNNELRVATAPNRHSSSQCHHTCDLEPPWKSKFAAGGTSPSAHHGDIRGARALHTLEESEKHPRPVCGPIAGPCPYEYEHWRPDQEHTAHAVRWQLTHEPATPRAARKPSFRRAAGETQIPDEGVRRRGFQPHASLSVAPGPGDIRTHSGTSGILTSTSHPFSRSTNLVPYRVVQVRPSRVSTCKSSDASQWSNDSSSPTDEGPSSGSPNP